MEAWRGFIEGNWTNEIDVRNFISLNYTPYLDGPEFLEGPTERTKRVSKRLDDLLRQEFEKGGVLDIDTHTVSTVFAFKPGYVIKEDDIIVGLQTDAPLKRAISPFAGFRMSEQACKAYGYEIGENIRDEFKYRTTHNTAVFKAYTDDMKRARHCGILTGLPDAYGRGRIIGDYRRIALYGMDYLMEQKKKDKANLGLNEMTEENIHLIEDVAKQLDFMQALKDQAALYGFDISNPATNAKEAIQ